MPFAFARPATPGSRWNTPMTRRLHDLRPWKIAVSLHRGLLLAAACCGLLGEDALGQTPRQPAASRSSQVQVALAEMPSDAAASAGAVRRDSQVVPAGALLHRHQRACPQGGCQLGAKCQGTCVVRPGRFGYYATQWRAWPGDAGVQQTSHQEMTPVSPPASAIPSVDEEALMPSSLLPDDDDTSFGSDNFGFEPVQPAVPTPQLPPPAQPGAADLLPGTPEPGTVTPPPATPEKPSLFDPPAPPQPTEKDEPEKKDESLDNLFDDFGRASQTRSGSLLRQRLAMANQQAAQAAAAKRVASVQPADAWKPKQLPATSTGKPLVGGATAAEPSRVVPTSASTPRPAPRSNPLR